MYKNKPETYAEVTQYVEVPKQTVIFTARTDGAKFESLQRARNYDLLHTAYLSNLTGGMSNEQFVQFLKDFATNCHIGD